MNNKYLLTFATLAGVAAGSVSTAALTARAGLPQTKQVDACVDLGAGAASTLETFLVNQLCSSVNSQLGTSDCAAADFQTDKRQLSIKYTDSKWRMCGTVERDGTWVVGSPE